MRLTCLFSTIRAMFFCDRLVSMHHEVTVLEAKRNAILKAAEKMHLKVFYLDSQIDQTQHEIQQYNSKEKK